MIEEWTIGEQGWGISGSEIDKAPAPPRSSWDSLLPIGTVECNQAPLAQKQGLGSHLGMVLTFLSLSLTVKAGAGIVPASTDRLIYAKRREQSLAPCFAVGIFALLTTAFPYQPLKRTPKPWIITGASSHTHPVVKLKYLLVPWRSQPLPNFCAFLIYLACWMSFSLLCSCFPADRLPPSLPFPLPNISLCLSSRNQLQPRPLEQCFPPLKHHHQCPSGAQFFQPPKYPLHASPLSSRCVELFVRGSAAHGQAKYLGPGQSSVMFTAQPLAQSLAYARGPQ